MSGSGQGTPVTITGTYTLQNIIDAVRYRLNNFELPYLWQDSELVFYANNVVNEICRKGRILTDSLTESCCQFSTVTDTMDYALHASIIYVKSVSLRTEELLTLNVKPAAAWSAGDTLTCSSTTSTCVVVSKVSDYYYKIEHRTGSFTVAGTISNGTYGASQTGLYPKFTDSVSCSLEKRNNDTMGNFRTFESGQPYAYCFDDSTSYITISKPDDVYRINMTVIRYPLVQLSTTSMSSQTPEIDSKYQDAIINGVCYQAYLKRGENTFNAQQADIYLKLYSKAISDMKIQNNLFSGIDETISPNKGFI